MADLLDRIAEELDDAETRILLEFKKIQDVPDETGLGKLPAEFREEVHTIVNELKAALDHSGTIDQLQLTTDQHESLRTRLFVINQLLDRQIPIAAFKQANTQLRKVQREKAPSQASVTTRAKPEIVVTSKQSGSILDSIKKLFGKDGHDTGRGQLRNVEKEAAGPKQIYQDTGVYGPAQQLAMLAQVVINVPPPNQTAQAGRKAARGKASFEARDLSSTMSDTPLKPKTAKADIAQTPEEIRRKLEARKHLSSNTGKAVFGTSDMANAAEPSLADKVAKQKQGLPVIKPQAGKGKATFVARDVQGIATDPVKLKEKLADIDMGKNDTEKSDNGNEKK